MKVKIFTFNPVQENTYVLYDETKECVIVDAGCFYAEEKASLLNFITDNKLTVKHLLNTHLHFDHTFGLNFINEQLQLKTEAHKADEFLLEMIPQQLEMFGFGKYTEVIPQVGKYLNENDIVTFGNQKMKVFHVPGHSPGSVVFYNQEAGHVLVGDVLFKNSVGRTDLPAGDQELLFNGIRTKLLTLPPSIVVYSGHGPSTSIGDEIKNNPFFR